MYIKISLLVVKLLVLPVKPILLQLSEPYTNPNQRQNTGYINANMWEESQSNPRETWWSLLSWLWPPPLGSLEPSKPRKPLRHVLTNVCWILEMKRSCIEVFPQISEKNLYFNIPFRGPHLFLLWRSWTLKYRSRALLWALWRSWALLWALWRSWTLIWRSLRWLWLRWLSLLVSFSLLLGSCSLLLRSFGSFRTQIF